MLVALEGINNSSLVLEYDCQSLFNYCFHHLEGFEDIVILEDSIYGMGEWCVENASSPNGVIFSMANFFNIQRENGGLFYEGKSISLISANFPTFISFFNYKGALNLIKDYYGL